MPINVYYSSILSRLKLVTIYDTFDCASNRFTNFKNSNFFSRESYDLRKGNNPFGAKKQVGKVVFVV